MPRQRKCKAINCGNKFTPKEPFQQWCSTDCAIKIARKKQDAARRKKKAEVRRKEADNRKAHRKDKERIKRRSEWIKETQAVFNKYIRIRDAQQPCISCGKTNEEAHSSDGWKPGGAWDCGHYLSIGSHPELRFDPDNAHKQCKSCNGGAGRYSKKNYTVSRQYRAKLIEKIGIERVELLEGPHESAKYSIDDIKAIKRKYLDMIKAFEV